jgi:hypothetical protein
VKDDVRCGPLVERFEPGVAQVRWQFGWSPEGQIGQLDVYALAVKLADELSNVVLIAGWPSEWTSNIKRIDDHMCAPAARPMLTSLE